MTQERLQVGSPRTRCRTRIIDGAQQLPGLRIARIRYYTPIVGGFVENILMRMAERALARRADRKRTASSPGTLESAAAPDPAAGLRDARLSAKARLARGGPLVRVLQGVTVLMDIDLLLFGRSARPVLRALER
jgi:hypothetical protein